MPTLHVVVPVFNERRTLEECLRRVLAAPLPEGWHARIELVDDCSDASAAAEARRVVELLRQESVAIELARHERNRGKGAALRTGFDRVLETAPLGDDLVVIQDADLEYDPRDFAALMAPILAGRCRAVLGTRWGAHRPLPSLKRRIHALGNHALTWCSNRMTGFRVSDMECCYKLVTVDLLRRLRPMLTEDRFGVEPQYVASLARLGERVEEVPVAYDPRGLEAGKKIGWRDGLRALWVIARERVRGAPARAAAAPEPTT